MKRTVTLLGAMMLLAGLLAGCVTRGYAGQENADATVGGQAAARLTPSPEIVDPREQNGASQAAGATPSILGSTPEAGQVGAWERHRFFDVWDLGYPDGWTVDRPGNGTVVLSGAYGEHSYRVELTRPPDVQTENVADWVQADLAKIDQTGAPRQEVRLKSLPALKVTNLKLPGMRENACPAVRVYARTDKIRGEENYLVMTITQTDPGQCDAVNIERLADAMIAEVRS